MDHDDWHLYYSKPVNLEAAIGSWMYHWPYLWAVRREAKVSALEIGCGRGIHSTFLSYSVPHIVGIDSNAELVLVARRQNAKLHGRAKFFQQDAFSLIFPEGSFDACFSQGFFEHFSDKEICLLVERQLSFAKTVVASIPSFYYPTRDKGNERLMQMEEWGRILRSFNVRMFYYGFEPKEQRKMVALKNLVDLKKIALSKFYRLHLCIIIKKAKP